MRTIAELKEALRTSKLSRKGRRHLIREIEDLKRYEEEAK